MPNWNEIFSIVDGNLVWAIKPANRVKIGDIVGHLNNGYEELNMQEGNIRPIELYGKW
jgi:hypothetical protein